MKEPLVREKEVVKSLGISRNTFRKLRDEGKIKYYQINGNSYRYNLSEIMDDLAVNTKKEGSLTK